MIGNWRRCSRLVNAYLVRLNIVPYELFDILGNVHSERVEDRSAGSPHVHEFLGYGLCRSRYHLLGCIRDREIVGYGEVWRVNGKREVSARGEPSSRYEQVRLCFQKRLHD